MAGRWRRLVLLPLLLALAAAAACRDSGGEGEFFEISGKLFVFNYRVATATYVVTLNPLQPMREDQTAIATFEDPAGGAPMVVKQKIWPKLRKVTLESDPLRCVVKSKPYAVSIAITNEDGSVAQKLETTIVSNLDQSVLPDKPLVVGPVYTPNPELAGHPDGQLPDDGTAPPCPAA
ncbi:MAG: hypothetical protein AB7S80_04510 [Rhizobiaceae bacterium]